MYQTKYKTTLIPYHWLLRAKALPTLKVVEVAEVAIEVEEVSFCAIDAKIFYPKKRANHKVANCPYQGQARDDWWKSQLSNIQGNPSNPDEENKEN